MAVKRKYRLNLRNYGNLPAIMLSQYDEGYALEFEIRDGTDAASDLSAYTVTLKGTRADTLAYSFAGTVSTNVLTFIIDTTMTACAGRGTAEIAIKDTANDVLFATFNMPVFVERAAVPEGSIDADVERAQEIAEQVQEIVDNAAAAVSGAAEKWATGQIDGTDVPSTDPAYENNAKYYAEQAAESAASIGIDATLTQAGKAADAKETGDQITELKEDLRLFDNGEKTFDASFAVGNIGFDSSAALGIKWDTTVKYRVSSTIAITITKGQVINIKSGFRLILFRNNGSGKYTSTTAWLTGSYTVPADVDCYMVIGKNPDVTGETANVSEFVHEVTTATNMDLKIDGIANELDLVEETTRNLIDCYKGTLSLNGLTIMCDGNGRYSITGTPTSQGGRTTPLTNYFTLAAGTYTFSSTLGSGIHFREINVTKKSDDTIIAHADFYHSSVTFTLNTNTEVYIGMNVYTNETYINTYNGLKFGLQIEKGSEQTKFIPHRTAVDYTVRAIEASEQSEKFIGLEKYGNNLAILTKFNNAQLRLSASVTQIDVDNPAFDFGGYTGAFVKTSDDDICPIYYNGSYRCAGHGSLTVFALTANSHGLSESDIGRVYTLNGVSWVLIKIVNSNTVWVISDITNEPTRPFVATIANSGTLANVAGNITYTAATLTQLRPQNINRSYSILVDDEPITADGTYYGEKVILAEKYESLNAVNMVSVLKANVGNNTNESYHADSIGGDVEYSVAYIFSSDSSCCVSETITVLRDNIDLSFIGLTQAQTYANTGYVPFTSFDTPATIGSTWTFSSANWNDADFPPYKYYELDLVNGKGFAVGYDISFGQGLPSNRKNNLSDAGNFNGTSKKMYPKFFGKGLVAPKGTKVSGNAFRCPILANNSGFGFTWQTRDATFVEIETFVAGTITIDIPNSAIGKTITVITPSDNIVISDGVVSDNVMTVIALGKGSATLKIV